MKLLIKLAIGALAVFVSAELIQGVEIIDLTTAFIVAVVLGVLNTFLKPVITILTLPINILTLGLFSLIINLSLILLAANIVPGFTVETVLAGLLFGLCVSLISSFLNMIAK